METSLTSELSLRESEFACGMAFGESDASDCWFEEFAGDEAERDAGAIIALGVTRRTGRGAAAASSPSLSRSLKGCSGDLRLVDGLELLRALLLLLLTRAKGFWLIGGARSEEASGFRTCRCPDRSLDWLDLERGVREIVRLSASEDSSDRTLRDRFPLFFSAALSSRACIAAMASSFCR